MYSEQDLKIIDGKIRKNFAVLTPIVVAILAVYIYALHVRIEWLAMAMGAVLFIALCYGIVAYLIPNISYHNFLRNMQLGLSRELRGTILSISDQAEMQDGARVLPVHLMLTEEQDERIVYLNASKREQLPPPGTEVRLRLYGRHIREVLPVEER